MTIMRKYLALLAAVCITAIAFAQKKDNFKFGKPSMEEMTMSVYEADPDAEAVILYENTEISYHIDAEMHIIQKRDFVRRVKILTKEGLDWANDYVLTYKGADEYYRSITKFEANTYNLKNGKIEKTKLDNSYTFHEPIDMEYSRFKWSLPAAMVGSVIEYRYSLESNIASNIATIFFTYEIPAVHIECSTYVPAYYIFTPRVSGDFPITLSKDVTYGSTKFGASGAFVAGTSSMEYAINVTKASVDNIPAYTREPLVWNSSKFRTRIDYDLLKIHIPGGVSKEYSTTWASVFNYLDNKDEKFYKYMNMKCPYSVGTDILVNADMNDTQKVEQALKTLHRRVIWNEKYSLIGEDPYDAYSEGKGSSSQLNFLLMSMLREMGIKAVPMLLNPRSVHSLSVLRPTVDHIHAFIVKVYPKGGIPFYVDATSKFGDIGVLPSDLLVDQAIEFKSGINPVNIVNTSNGSSLINADVTFSDDLESIKVKIEGRHLKQNAMDITEGSALIPGLKADVVDIKTIKAPGECTFSMEYNDAVEFTGDRIFLPATVIPAPISNHLTAAERKLPIQFNHPEQYTLQVTIHIPEGYESEDLPVNKTTRACNSKLYSHYITTYKDGCYYITYNFGLHEALFSKGDYSELKNFFSEVEDIMSSTIVLKKSE